MAVVLNSVDVLRKIFDSIIKNPEDKTISVILNRALPYGEYVFGRYDIISEYIYKLDTSQYLILKTYFGEPTNFNSPSYEKMRLDLNQSMENNDILDKFERHIKLACHQRDFILDNVSEANEIAEGLLETKTKIYSEFIAILGIFTAISFALMGSIQTFGTVFAKVDNPSTASIGFAIMAGAIYLIIMIVLITVLFVGMQSVIKTNNDKFPRWIIWTTISAISVLVIVGLTLLIIK